MNFHPRAKAHKQNEAKKICDKEGHLPATASWYSRYERQDSPCLRGCGENVSPKISYDGHP